jgi:putative ABC transport system ATP-binding protein
VRLSPKAIILGKLFAGALEAAGGGAGSLDALDWLLHETKTAAPIKITKSRKFFMIELSKVSKTVPSGSEMLTILHSLDLIIPDGQFVAVVGASGSGKSTLLGLIAGLDSPTSGVIRIDGQAITEMSEDRLAELRGEKIGFVFQSFHLMPSLTAFENVIVPMEIAGVKDARSRANQLLEDVDLAARAHHYPSQLSGGEKQRVAIARAFANDPSILLADEPTGNLDSRNGRHVLELMTEMNRRRNTTLVLVTHDAEIAAMADRQISLRDGRVITDTGAQAQEVEASEV